MQTGTFDQGTPQRTHRVKPLALSLAGSLIAVALIGGGVAGLDRHLLSNDGVRPFDGRSDGDAVVLAPAQPRTILDRAAPGAFVPGPDGATVAPRVTDRADRGTGGAAAPRERAVRVGRAAPADERPVGDATTTGFTASFDSDDDTDGDGLPNVVEDDGAANETEAAQGITLAGSDGPAAPEPALAPALDRTAAPAPEQSPAPAPAPASR